MVLMFVNSCQTWYTSLTMSPHKRPGETEPTEYVNEDDLDNLRIYLYVGRKALMNSSAVWWEGHGRTSFDHVLEKARSTPNRGMILRYYELCHGIDLAVLSRLSRTADIAYRIKNNLVTAHGDFIIDGKEWPKESTVYDNPAAAQAIHQAKPPIESEYWWLNEWQGRDGVARKTDRRPRRRLAMADTIATIATGTPALLLSGNLASSAAIALASGIATEVVGVTTIAQRRRRWAADAAHRFALLDPTSPEAKRTEISQVPYLFSFSATSIEQIVKTHAPDNPDQVDAIRTALQDIAELDATQRALSPYLDNEFSRDNATEEKKRIIEATENRAAQLKAEIAAIEAGDERARQRAINKSRTEAREQAIARLRQHFETVAAALDDETVSTIERQAARKFGKLAHLITEQHGSATKATLQKLENLDHLLKSIASALPLCDAEQKTLLSSEVIISREDVIKKLYKRLRADFGKYFDEEYPAFYRSLVEPRPEELPGNSQASLTWTTLPEPPIHNGDNLR